MKKYVAEFFGTFILVFIGCGTAMLVGCDAANGSGYLLTALAFGLAIVTMAYGLGNISGGHVNPAVSLAVFINGGISSTDLVGYIVAQVLGATAGSGILAAIFALCGLQDMTGGLGCNGLPGGSSPMLGAILVEIITTCIFIVTILGVTSKKQSHGSFGGLVIGLTLVALHIVSIGITGTSVNPARSLGPAIVAAICGNTKGISAVIAFIIGPCIGAAIGAFLYKWLETSDESKGKSRKK
ncbi:MAG: aquaporin [Lachnospiraceae bacterium]|nr:aquaporin [Lachnospiraceae bacterium]